MIIVVVSMVSLMGFIFACACAHDIAKYFRSRRDVRKWQERREARAREHAEAALRARDMMPRGGNSVGVGSGGVAVVPAVTSIQQQEADVEMGSLSISKSKEEH